MNDKCKVVIVERYGDTVITGSKYTDLLDDAREIYESIKNNPNVVSISLWVNNYELEKFDKSNNNNQ